MQIFTLSFNLYVNAALTHHIYILHAKSINFMYWYIFPCLSQEYQRLLTLSITFQPSFDLQETILQNVESFFICFLVFISINLKPKSFNEFKTKD